MIPITGFEGYAINEKGQVINIRKGNNLTPHLNENGYMYVTLRRNNRNVTTAVHRLVAETYIPNPEKKPFVNHIDANRSNPHKENLEWCTQSENIKHAYKLGNMSQKKNFNPEELDEFLTQLIDGSVNMTDIAKRMGVGHSRLTINMRNRAYKTNRVAEMEKVLTEQKHQRNTEANVSKRKPVMQLDLTGKVLATYLSATAAARALGKVTSGPISNTLNPKNPQKIGYGYLWKYI